MRCDCCDAGRTCEVQRLRAWQVDDNHSGTLEFEEFLRLMAGKMSAPQGSVHGSAHGSAHASPGPQKLTQSQRLELRQTFDFFDKVRRRPPAWGCCAGRGGRCVEHRVNHRVLRQAGQR